MRFAFVINGIQSEEDGYTTTRLAFEATKRGHDVWYIGVEDFLYDTDDVLRAHGRTAPKGSFDSAERYFEELRGENARLERISVEELDLVMLRNDPSADAVDRPWAQNVAVVFGQMASRRGVLVLNDPDGLAQAQNKLYFQSFPEEVRPITLITRSSDDIKKFIEEHHHVVLKPLQGSGGTSVFLVREEDDLPNVNQMIDAVSRDGYVVAQKYLPAAADGDVRLFLMNGEPLVCEGKYGAFRRVSAAGDLRSNIHAGGTQERAEVTPVMLRIAEAVKPKLVADGMFLAGLDIAGDKLLEINVFSPGGLNSAQDLERVNFGLTVVEELERRVTAHRR